MKQLQHQPRMARRIRCTVCCITLCLWSSFTSLVFLTFCQWECPANRTGVFSSQECSSPSAHAGLVRTAWGYRTGNLINWQRHCRHRWPTALDSISETHTQTFYFLPLTTVKWFSATQTKSKNKSFGISGILQNIIQYKCRLAVARDKTGLKSKPVSVQSNQFSNWIPCRADNDRPFFLSVPYTDISLPV